MRRRLSLAALVLALASCSPPALLTGFDRLFPEEGYRVATDVPFGPLPRQQLDIWSPQRRTVRGARLPVLVFFYGGGWVAGSRQEYGFAGRAFASKGFLVVIPDYRLVPQVRFPTFVEDGALAIRWTRDHIAAFGGDPQRISVAGHSAGAYNAAMLALDPHYLRDVGVDPKIIRAGALLAGPYDFYPFTEARGRDALGAWPRPRETQPISFARRDAPPLLLAAGTADQVVQPRNSERLAERLRAVGAPVTLKLYPGRSHVDLAKALSKPFRRTAPVLDDSARFLLENSR